MVAQHYRWDFIGLSTEEKPTPATSEKVVDGSTFYCSDNSKLYVFCDGTWYEKTVSGGTTYTAGDGIDITNSTISVDPIVEVDYLDYNPDLIDTPDMYMAEFFASTNVQTGQILRFYLNEVQDSQQARFRLSEDKYRQYGVFYEDWQTHEISHVDFVILGRYEGSDTQTTEFSVLSPAGEFLRMTALSDPDSPFYLVEEYSTLTSYLVDWTLNEIDYPISLISGEDTKDVVSTLLSSSTNIDGLSKITAQGVQDILQQDPDDTDGDMPFTSDNDYDYSSVAMGSEVDVWFRGKDGLPLWLNTNFYLKENGIDIESNGTTIHATLDDGIIEEGRLKGNFNYRLRHTYDDEWVLNGGIEVTFEQRSMGGGSGVIELTSADYDWPTDSPDGIALWLLDTGVYKFNGIKVYASGNEAWSNSLTALGTIDKRNNGSYFTYINGTKEFNRVYVAQASYTQNALMNLSPVQTTGTSTTDVMSQNATTSLVYADPSTKQKVLLGLSATNNGQNGVAIGVSSNAASNRSIAIGAMATSNNSYAIAVGNNTIAGHQGSVALGANASTSRAGEVYIGSTETSEGFNSTNYRVIGGLHDGQLAHDAATVAQGNKLMTTAPTTTDAGVLGQLWTDTTAMHTYQLTAIDTTDPDNPVYTWAQRW